MKIDIGNNNKINNSIIGNNNSTKSKKEKSNKFRSIVFEILIGLIISLLAAYIVHKLGWNK